jgi:hypothetical protein
MLRYCPIRSLGTMPNAEIRIQTPYAAAPCGSITTIPPKISTNTIHATLAHFEPVFSLILGLG